MHRTWCGGLFGAACWLVICGEPAGSFAQGSADDYARALQIGQRTRGRVFRDRVVLNWLPGGDHAWYRVDTAPGDYEFVFVDALAGERSPAFDHVRLAEALQQETGREVSPVRLPIRRLNYSEDRSLIRFTALGTAWEYDRDLQALRRTGSGDEEGHEESLPVLARPRRSTDAGGDTSIVFVNRLAEPVEILWVDRSGGNVKYATLEPQAEHAQHTYAGHVWLVQNLQGEQIAVYAAIDEPARAVIDGRAAEGERRERGRPAIENVPRRRSANLSPSGEYEAFVRDHNVWAREVETRVEFPLSTDGHADDPYVDRFFWSPDSRRLVVLQTRPGETRQVHLISSAPEEQLQPMLITFDYNKPGDVMPVSRPRLFDLEGRRQIKVSDELFPNAWSLQRFHWWPDGSAFTCLYNERGHQVLRIVEINADTGETRSLIEEQSPTFVDYAHKEYTHYLDETREILWMSERDGWNHLYLYHGWTGELVPVTSGPWVVRNVERVDEVQRQVWFRAGGIVPGQDPYYLHLCRVNFDGSELTVLTEGDGTHTWEDSPDGRYLVDVYSRVDLPPITTLRRASDGSEICLLETADWSRLLEIGWQPPERFVAPGRDGQTEIYGIIVRPIGFEPGREYPVIEKIYAGPQGAFVPKAFSRLTEMYALAELGFIVVQIDGMGTSHRSKAFHDVCWQNLGDAGFPDRIAWLRAAAEQYPELDLSRVGIYGGSAGGQNALRGMLMYPDFYKVGAADCGCHDNRMDKIWWNELWMGWPIGPHYEEQSNVTQAHRLEGKLLLIVGELDRNVDPASTMQVVGALIRANKDFDLLVIPGAGHGAGGSAYGQRRQWDFFVRHLHGMEPRWTAAAAEL